MKSDSIAQLAKALSMAQGEMKPAKMDSVNPFLKNKYADLGSVIEAARPALTKNGLSFSQFVETSNGGVTVETLLMHASGEWLSTAITMPLGEEKGRSLVQNAGSIITYLRRYSLSTILGIYADEDIDGGEKKPAPKAAVVQVAQSQPTMALETAQAVTNSQGVKYGEIPVETLAHMANSITKELAKDHTPEDLENYRYKLSAIQTILAQ